VYLLITGSLNGVQLGLAIGYASCGTLALAAIFISPSKPQ
jgi:hypothetical protein